MQELIHAIGIFIIAIAVASPFIVIENGLKYYLKFVSITGIIYLTLYLGISLMRY